jgi:hypothetical protein
LVSACRYSFMGRYKGKTLEMCEHYERSFGAAAGSDYYARPTMADRQRMNPQSRYAKGSINNQPYDLFTGKKFGGQSGDFLATWSFWILLKC